MPETGDSSVVTLLYVCIGLLVLVLLGQLRLGARLKRLEKGGQKPANAAAQKENEPSAAESAPGGAFEAFLGEDPARRELPKSEQFAAYRQWRQEKGLNWSQP